MIEEAVKKIKEKFDIKMEKQPNGDYLCRVKNSKGNIELRIRLWETCFSESKAPDSKVINYSITGKWRVSYFYDHGRTDDERKLMKEIAYSLGCISDWYEEEQQW